MNLILNSGQLSIRTNNASGGHKLSWRASTLLNSTWMLAGNAISGGSGTVHLNPGAVGVTGAVDAFTDSVNAVSIGRYGTACRGCWVGDVDEVCVSNTVRSASYLTARYDQEKGGQRMVTIGPEN